DSIGGRISPPHHARHRADADPPDVLSLCELHQFAFRHGSRISIVEQHFMFRRSDRFQQKHPKVRHEISRNAVVGVVEEYFHCRRLRIARSLVLVRRDARSAGIKGRRKSGGGSELCYHGLTRPRRLHETRSAPPFSTPSSPLAFVWRGERPRFDLSSMPSTRLQAKRNPRNWPDRFDSNRCALVEGLAF